MQGENYNPSSAQDSHCARPYLRFIIFRMFKRTLITCALPYANGPLHIGQIAGAHLPGDIFYRFTRLMAREAIHICGTDDHGVANIVAAEKKGLTPDQNTQLYYESFTRTLSLWEIRYSNFSQTKRPLHHRIAQGFFMRLYERGYFYKQDIEQHFCESCGRFLPERYIQGRCPFCGFGEARGDQCESCGRWLEPTQLVEPHCTVCGSAPVIRRTWHYYFKLRELAPRLREWLEAKTDWKPNVRNKALAWLDEGLADRPITRDLSWGVPVPVPEAKGKVLYVWFDAPIGYITSTAEFCRENEECWKGWWQDPETRIIHFIGKDNIVFHALIWPGMLMAHGDYTLPDNVPANEFLNLMGKKLSTSRNWAVWAEDFARAFGTDYARYGVAMVLPETKDSDFDWRLFAAGVNNNLVNTYGNLVHRALSFVNRFMNGRVPDASLDPEVVCTLREYHERITGLMETFQFRKALSEIHDLALAGNEYFNRQAPWKAIKENPSSAETCLYSVVQIIRALTVLYEPFIPVSSGEIRAMLGLGDVSWEDSAREDVNLRGASLREIRPPFRKIEEDRVNEEIAKLEQAAPQ